MNRADRAAIGAEVAAFGEQQSKLGRNALVETCSEVVDALVIESDAPEAEEAAPRKKRKSSTSPTARTMAELRKREWPAGIVERFVSFPKPGHRVDLFGVIDIVALVPDWVSTVPWPAAPASRSGILGIQATINRSGEHAAHRAKILAEPRALEWIKAGARLELWSWALQGARGKQKRWTLRVEAFTVEDWSKP